jgi:hypothetical protein
MANKHEEYPFDMVDLACIFVAAAMNWFVPIAFAQYFIRRNETIRGDIAALADWTYTARLLPSPAPQLTVPDTLTDAPPDTTLHSLLQQPANTAAPATAAAPPADTVVPWKTWRVQAVKAHHLLIIGNTDSGKTTLVRALLPGKRGALLVIDPKNRPGKWGQIQAIGLDDDAEYTQIEQALQQVLRELRQRQRALNHGETDFQPLTVVVDEAPDVADECSTFPLLFKRVGSVGRELQISLIVLSQRSTVRALGIEGDGQSRDNFTKILMGKFARQAAPSLAGQRYCAVLDAEGDQHVLDVAPLPTYAQLPLKAEVVSGIAESNTSDTDSVPVRTGTYQHTAHTTPKPAPATDTGITDEQIREMKQQGLSDNKICAYLSGSKPARLARIRQALDQAGNDDEPPPAFRMLGG